MQPQGLLHLGLKSVKELATAIAKDRTNNLTIEITYFTRKGEGFDLPFMDKLIKTEMKLEYKSI